MGTLAATKEHEIARPLPVLAKLIKEKIKEADEAAAAATRPYWGEIGDMLLEAKGQFNKGSDFYEWAKRQFDIGRHQVQRYIQVVTAETIERRAPRPDTLSDALRSIGKSPRGHHGLTAREWIKPIDDIADRARRDAERIRDEELTRQQEREVERVLAIRLIDIGWKVLAKELHPDSGGSRDAMARLNKVRDRLKAHA